MQCLINKNVIELVKIEKNITLDIAIKAKKNIQHSRENEENAIRTVTGILLMSSEYFNVGNKLNEIQAVQTASLFLEQYPIESIEDLILCLKNAKTAKYGKIYRVDGETIFKWFQLYLNEKYERFEQIKQNEKIEANELLNNSFTADQLKSIEELIHSIKINQKEKLQPDRITDKKHLSEFKQNINYYSPEDLEILKAQFIQLSENSFFSKYDDYIELINNRQYELKSA